MLKFLNVALVGVAVSFAAVGGVTAQEWLSPRPLQQTKPTAQPQRQTTQQQKPTQQGPQQAQQQAPQQQAGAQSNPAMAEDVGDWRIVCFDAPQRACQISQRQVNPQTQGLVVWVELTRATRPKPGTYLAIMVPLGIRIAPNLSLFADSTQLQSVPIITCVQSGCLHQGEINNNAVASLQKATAASTRVVDNTSGRTVTLGVSMKGFKEAYEKTSAFLRRT